VQAAGVAVGQSAPAVSLPQLSGAGEVSLESLQGKVVYLDFWASWCPPCRISFPILEQLRVELGPDGFEVLAINLDEVEADAQQFLSDTPVSYPVVRDAAADSPKAFGMMGTGRALCAKSTRDFAEVMARNCTLRLPSYWENNNSEILDKLSARACAGWMYNSTTVGAGYARQRRNAVADQCG
jgi:thiol-disulfide isomerase/thioredoxin